MKKYVTLFCLILLLLTMKKLKYLLLALLLCFVGNASAARHSFVIKNGNFVYNGKPVMIHAGEMHYARIPAPYWRHRIKMMKAMGLNAVATYVFWNFHETSPGVWDWQTGSHNIRQFLKDCAAEGMMVILRPGPYCCAEWEFGGYPWWLPKTDGLVIRSYNQPFLDSCRVYINQLAGQVRDLQVTHGGPIVMVQAENEFGSYVAQRNDISLQQHKQYSAAIRQELLDAGFNIPTYTADGSWLFEEGSIKGALPTANGEGDVKKVKEVVNKYNGGKGPYMVAEFYPGWLDHWNEPFSTVNKADVAKQMTEYLDGGVSFSFYMIHGGTNFGFTSGANYNNEVSLQPDMTSYDYDAPISEAGWNTPKYDTLRSILLKYVKYKVPAVPARLPVISVPDIRFSKTVDLFDVVKGIKPVVNDTPMTFEDLNQGYGYVLYRRTFEKSMSGVLKFPGIADYGIVYVDGKKVGEISNITGKYTVSVNIPKGGTLDILVENMGRINYGARIVESNKGIILPIYLESTEVKGNWQMFRLPMSEVPDVDDITEGYKAGLPVLYSGTFNLEQTGDTFLDMEKWGKGIVFVNGINLGRYWKVGPQQTLYLPGCFLKVGENKIVVFEQQNDKRQESLQGVTVPVLEKLVKE